MEDGVLTQRGSVMVDELTNTLIVRDIDARHRNARELVRRLDVQTPQVLIESNIVEATTRLRPRSRHPVGLPGQHRARRPATRRA